MTIRNRLPCSLLAFIRMVLLIGTTTITTNTQAFSIIPQRRRITQQRKTFVALSKHIINTSSSFGIALYATKKKGGGGGFGSGGGGGGFGGTSSSSGKKKGTKKKQKRKEEFSDLISSSTTKDTTTITTTTTTDDDDKSSSDDKSKTPELDKWGLPVATIDDLFPPMSPDTELIPIDEEKVYSLDHIQECLKDHIDLKLDKWFDKNGKEKMLQEGKEKEEEEKRQRRKPIQIKLLHQSPPVLEFENFFTKKECEIIKNEINNEQSYQVNSATFTGALSTRTSTSWFVNYSQVPILLSKTNNLLNIPLEVMEEPQIVRYQIGQEFSWHYDEIPKSQLTNGGQRLATLLLYLNNINTFNVDGGGTIFRDLQQSSSSSSKPNISLTMRPKQGSALLFFPAFANGQPDDRTLHKGEIMTKKNNNVDDGNDNDNEKWIIQMWIHQHAYKAILPPGNTHGAARIKMEATSKELGYTHN